jgi:hypothetical protein
MAWKKRLICFPKSGDGGVENQVNSLAYLFSYAIHTTLYIFIPLLCRLLLDVECR